MRAAVMPGGAQGVAHLMRGEGHRPVPVNVARENRTRPGRVAPGTASSGRAYRGGVQGAGGGEIAVCVSGGAVDADAVCIEHGTTECVRAFNKDENCLEEPPDPRTAPAA